MGMNITSAQLTGSFIKEQLGDYTSFFGFFEMMENGSLDVVNRWVETSVNTGAHDILAGRFRIKTGAGAGSSERLCIQTRFPARTDNFATGGDYTGFNSFIMEFEIDIDDIANMDNSSFFGISGSSTASRTTNDSIGIITDGTKIIGLVDTGGVEQTADLITASLEDKYLIKIELCADGVKFYVDGTLIDTITTTNVPVQYLQFFIANNAAAACTCAFGFVRAYFTKGSD